MDERTCRLWAAAEARALGRDGEVLVATATGLSRGCIRAGLLDLEQLEAGDPNTALHEQPMPRRTSYWWRPRVRRPGGGRKLTEVKYPSIKAVLEELLTNEIAGDPMSEKKWVRSSTRQLSRRLKDRRYQASPATVARLLKDTGFSLKANKRKQGSFNCPQRNTQFEYIASQRQKFHASGLPIISIDTKKKELIGNFRNTGRVWCKQPDEVNEHDFPGTAECRAVPFGIYDVTRNEGFVVVGISNDTPEFAVACIARWWKDQGRAAYPHAKRLLILADSGASNGYRSRAWKQNLSGEDMRQIAAEVDGLSLSDGLLEVESS